VQRDHTDVVAAGGWGQGRPQNRWCGRLDHARERRHRSTDDQYDGQRQRKQQGSCDAVVAGYLCDKSRRHELP
jgi:hypothetical protein